MKETSRVPAPGAGSSLQLAHTKAACTGDHSVVSLAFKVAKLPVLCSITASAASQWSLGEIKRRKNIWGEAFVYDINIFYY